MKENKNMNLLFEGAAPSSNDLCLSVQRVKKMAEKNSFSVLENPDVLRELETINRFLKLEPMESLILTPFIYKKLMNKNNPDVEYIATWLQVDLREVLMIHRTILKLCTKGLLKKINEDYESYGRYILTERVYKAILGDDPLEEREVTSEKNLENFLDSFNNLYQMYQSGEWKHSIFIEEVRALLEEYSEIQGVARIKDTGLDDEELVILMMVIYKTVVLLEEEVNVDRIIKNLELPLHKRMNLNKSFMKGENDLLKKNLLRFGDTMWKSTAEMSLSSEMLNYMTGVEQKEKTTIPLKRGILIDPSANRSPELFYNKEEEKEMVVIEKVLSPEGYDSLRSEMEKRNMNKGMTVLLYGPPGTGKTSSVYALAARTGRKVYKVEVESVNSMYVGESEKNLVEIFKEYDKLVKTEEKHPILLLNECDGLLKKRMSGGNNSVTEMMNTMTTLLLEKLENLDGIVFGTMNTPNFDSAFERRFLFKLELKKPDTLTRTRIMRDQFPELSESTLGMISEKYDLTGGQIANIRKKFTIKSLVNPEITLDECMDELCEYELILNKPRKSPIGFLNNKL